MIFSSAIDVGSVTYSHHQHDEFSILYVADEPIISDAIAPILSQLPAQTFSYAPWIIEFRNTVVQEVGYAARVLPIELP
jgi:hypothetical protein